MMRRSRKIKPEFFTSEDVLALPRDVRLTFIGLWLYADDYGNERINSALLKASIWPLDDDITTSVLDEHLLMLADHQMLTLYAVDGRDYFHITNWDRHQRVDKPSASTIPLPPDLEASRDSREGRASEGGERREGVERECGEGAPGCDQVGSLGGGERVRPRSALPPSPFCPRHPTGTDKACKPCGNARLAFKAWELAREAEV